MKWTIRVHLRINGTTTRTKSLGQCDLSGYYNITSGYYNVTCIDQATGPNCALSDKRRCICIQQSREMFFFVPGLDCHRID